MFKITKSKFWQEFIELYKSFPELWNTKNENFKNKNLKEKALDALAVKLQEQTPHGDVKMVRKKIKTLRAVFTKEYQIKKLNEELGTDSNEQLWYFEKLKFLLNDKVGCSLSTNGAIDISDDDEVTFIEPFSSNETDTLNCSKKRQIAEVQHEFSNNSMQVQKKTRQTENETLKFNHLPFVKMKDDLSQTLQIESEQVQDQQIQFMERESYGCNASNGINGGNENQHSTNVQNELPKYTEQKTLTQTESEMVGFNVSKKLMKMNEFQQILAENLIYKILLMGVCGELTRASDIQNP